MRLFQCDICGCCENAALASQGFVEMADRFDWTGIEDRQSKKLCSACGPTKYADGKPTKYGRWHGIFERVFLPIGIFRAARNGNVEHAKTCDQDYLKYRVLNQNLNKDLPQAKQPIPHVNPESKNYLMQATCFNY